MEEYAPFLPRIGERLFEFVLIGDRPDAAQRIGMTRETAYRLRRRNGAESFAAAWDTIVRRLRGKADLPKRKVTHFELVERAYHGTLRPVPPRS